MGLDPYGTDIAENMIQATVERFTGKVADPKDRFRLCRAGEIPFEGMKFDVITAIQLFPYIEQYAPYIRKLRSLLAPGGIIAATSTNRFSLWVMHEIASRAFRLPPHLRTIRNLARTGYQSGGHVDYRKARQAYCAKRFDALFAAEGFDLIDAMDYYHIRRLDGDPLNRHGLGSFLARHLAWYHVGVYRKTDAKMQPANTAEAVPGRSCVS
jgi:ubiquinone/menaquinone biosynthesis C-methylase UbiE